MLAVLLQTGLATAAIVLAAQGSKGLLYPSCRNSRSSSELDGEGAIGNASETLFPRRFQQQFVGKRL